MRIIFEHLEFANWTDWCPFAAFAISFAVFIAWLWWAFHLPSEGLDRMANLPFDDDSLEVPTPTHSSTASVPHAKE